MLLSHHSHSSFPRPSLPLSLGLSVRTSLLSLPHFSVFSRRAHSSNFTVRAEQVSTGPKDSHAPHWITGDQIRRLSLSVRPKKVSWLTGNKCWLCSPVFTLCFHCLYISFSFALFGLWTQSFTLSLTPSPGQVAKLGGAAQSVCFHEAVWTVNILELLRVGLRRLSCFKKNKSTLLWCRPLALTKGGSRNVVTRVKLFS